MAHLYKSTYWQDGTGKWECNDVEEIPTDATKWYAPCRVLGISPAEFLKLIRDEFHAVNISYSKEYKMAHFCWKTEEDVKRFVKFINDAAKKKNFICGQRPKK